MPRKLKYHIFLLLMIQIFITVKIVSFFASKSGGLVERWFMNDDNSKFVEKETIEDADYTTGETRAVIEGLDPELHVHRKDWVVKSDVHRKDWVVKSHVDSKHVVMKPQEVDMNPEQQNMKALHENMKAFYENVKALDENVKPLDPHVNSQNSVLGHHGNATSDETRNMFYLKIHKTGSTTFHNILCRFGLKRDLKIALFTSMYGKPFPDICKPELLFEIMDPRTFTPYNIACDHAIYDEVYPYAYMQKNSVSVALIREPFSRLKSAFRYFGLAKQLKLNGTQFPVYEFLKQINESTNIWKVPFWTDNTQMVTFGWKKGTKDNITVGQEFIRRIDSKFDLVLLLERFHESLILMKRRYKWKIRDILHAVNNRFPKSEIPSGDREKELMIETNKKLSKFDYVLYEYFSAKLNTMISQQSSDFKHEVAYFKSLNSNITAKCILKWTNFRQKLLPFAPSRNVIFQMLNSEILTVAESQWSEQFSMQLKDCRLLTIDTLHYHNALRVRQFPQTCNVTSGPQVRPAYYENHRIGSNWCLNDTSDIYNFALETFVGFKLKHKLV